MAQFYLEKIIVQLPKEKLEELDSFSKEQGFKSTSELIKMQKLWVTDNQTTQEHTKRKDFIPDYLNLHNTSNTFTKSFAEFMHRRSS